MILHTFSASPESSAFRDCLSSLSSEDAVLLLGDGAYAALPACTYLTQLGDAGATVYALRADALAAGMAEPGPGVKLIDMPEFVALTERYPRQIAWF